MLPLSEIHEGREVLTSTEVYQRSQPWPEMMRRYGTNANRRDRYSEYAEPGGFSQSGEHGVLKKIFDVIGTGQRRYVEFGAWDGCRYSNTADLRRKHAWSGLLLEGDPDRVRSTPDAAAINLRHAVVTAENINSLFASHGVSRDLDLLSIDIDGYDYWVWAALQYRPRVVIVETHPGLPNDLALTIEYADHCLNTEARAYEGYFGMNLRAAYRLAAVKGYAFVTTVTWNAVFVRIEDFPALALPVLSENETVERYFRPEPFWERRRDGRDGLWRCV